MNNEKGMVAIALAASTAALVAVLMILSTQHFERMTKGFRESEGKRFSEEIGNSLAIKIRAAYDLGRNVATTPCPAGTAIFAFSGVNLCAPAGQICTAHPLSIPGTPPVMVCIENPPIVAASVDSLKRKLLQDLILPKVAFAQSSLPLPPVYAGTLVLPVNPRIRCAGRACRTNPAEELVMTCANSDCVTFAFCPLIGGNCRPNQRVIQTIAFFR